MNMNTMNAGGMGMGSMQMQMQSNVFPMQKQQKPYDYYAMNKGGPDNNSIGLYLFVFFERNFF